MTPELMLLEEMAESLRALADDEWPSISLSDQDMRLRLAKDILRRYDELPR